MFTKKRDGMFDTASAALCRDYFLAHVKINKKPWYTFFLRWSPSPKKKNTIKKKKRCRDYFLCTEKNNQKNYSQTVSVKQLTHLAKAQEVKKVHPRRQYYISGFVHWLIDKLNENIL